MPPPRAKDIVGGKRGVTAGTALRLSKYFGTTPQFWMNLQDSYEICCVLREAREDIDKIESFSSKI